MDPPDLSAAVNEDHRWEGHDVVEHRQRLLRFLPAGETGVQKRVFDIVFVLESLDLFLRGFFKF